MNEIIQKIKEFMKGDLNGAIFEVLIPNKKLGDLLVRCVLMRENNNVFICLSVYNKNNQELKYEYAPMATSKMRVDKEYACVEKVYVGRKCRRCGLGSALVEIMEDIVGITDNKKRLFAKKAFGLMDKDIKEIREAYGNPNSPKGVVDYLFSHKFGKYNETITYKFLKSLGYMAEKYNPYDYPEKINTTKNGYFISENNEPLKAYRPEERIANREEM